MKKFSKAQGIRIRSLTKKGKTQEQIALALHTRKQNVATYLKKAKIGKRTTGAARFWKDVKTTKKLGEYDYKGAIHATKIMPKWLKKRVARLSEKERLFHARWAAFDREFRASEFAKGRPEGMTDKMMEDYEDYWETP